MNSQIILKIKESQLGNDESLLWLISKFNPIINKYSKKLNYEDSYEEMQFLFIKAIKNIKINKIRNESDGALVKYLERIIYNNFIMSSKHYEYIKSHEFNINDDIYHGENMAEENDDYSNLLLFNLRKLLNEKEYRVIYYYFYEEYKTEEIADVLGESVWNIYKLKKSALEKLKTNL